MNTPCGTRTHDLPLPSLTKVRLFRRRAHYPTVLKEHESILKSCSKLDCARRESNPDYNLSWSARSLWKSCILPLNYKRWCDAFACRTQGSPPLLTHCSRRLSESILESRDIATPKLFIIVLSRECGGYSCYQHLEL